MASRRRTRNTFQLKVRKLPSSDQYKTYSHNQAAALALHFLPLDPPLGLLRLLRVSLTEIFPDAVLEGRSESFPCDCAQLEVFASELLLYFSSGWAFLDHALRVAFAS